MGPTELQSALFGVLLLAGAAVLTPVGIELARRIAPGRRVLFTRWGFTHAGLVVAVGLSALVLTGLLAPRFDAPDAPDVAVESAAAAEATPDVERATAPGEERGGLLPIVQTQAILLAAAGAAFLVARACEPKPFAALGLRAGGNGRALLCGAASFVFFWPAIHGSYEVWRFTYDQLPGAPWAPQELASTIGAMSGPELAAAAFIAVVVAPFLEELLFRGFLQPLLVQNLSDRGGIAATSVLFALLHGTAAFLPIFVLSLVIGGVMLRTQRLGAAWLVHALNNGLSILLLVRESASAS